MITERNINLTYGRIIDFLDKKELKNALGLIHTLMQENNNSALEEKLSSLQQTYKYLLRYRMNGVVDPMHDKIYHDVLIQAYQLANTVKFTLLAACEPPSVYYGLRKHFQNIDAITFEDIYNQLLISTQSSSKMFGETIYRLFCKIWLSGELTEENKAVVSNMLRNKELPYITGCQIVSALTLSLMTLFTPEKLLLMMQAADEGVDDEIRARALTGVLIILYMYRKRIELYPEIINRLESLAEQPGFIKRVRNITLRFLLAKETEKITRKLNDEIFPAIMKHAPDIQKLTLGELNTEMLNDKNPEWMDIKLDSSLEKTIEEYTELQNEGADVMLYAFAETKNIEFFNHTNNWFMPFCPELCISDYKGNDESIQKMGELTKSLIFLCNSDKYSFFFNITNSTSWKNTFFSEKISGMFMDMLEQYNKDFIVNKDNQEVIAGMYIQDLYRFFKLYRGDGGYEDIFMLPLDFYNVSVLKPYFDDSESLSTIAEYYLKKNCFDEALALFTVLGQRDSNNDMVMQKTGYCQQMKGNIQEALEEYLKADLINTKSKWLTRRIAGCYRALNQPEKAIEYYRRLETLSPENLSIQLSIGHCYLEQRKYTEALKYYFKVDYLDSKSNKVERPIAWCLFLTGKFEQASGYYNKILQQESPTMHDYMNAGHTAWAMQNLNQTVNFYKQAIQQEEDNGATLFLEHFEKDTPHLIAAGINKDEIPLVLDQVRYEI